MATPPLPSPVPRPPNTDSAPSLVLAPTQRVLPEVIGAIDDEIAATPQPEPASVTLRDGRLVRDHGRFTYRFKMPLGVSSLPREAYAQGTADGAPVKGNLRTVGRRRVRFETDSSLGASIRLLTISLSTTFLLEALRERIKELGTKGMGTYPSINRLLGQLPPDIHRVATRLARTAGAPALNRQQRQAVETAIGSGLLMIWGPAGTGKSLTLAELAMEFVAAGKSVLVLGPSHKSIDSILAKLVAHPEAGPLIERAQLLRYGAIENAQLRASHGHAVELARVAATRREATERELELAEADLESMQRSPHSCTDFEQDQDRHIAYVDALKQQLSRERTTLISDCKIMVATIHQTFLNGLGTRTFSAVVVDEASMVSPVMAIAAAALSTQHLVCAGDLRQLAPICVARSPRAERWIARDVFETSGVTAAIENGGGSVPHLVMLTQQHRMASELSACVSKIWYNGRLRNAPSIRRTSALVPRPALTLIDTSPLGPTSERHMGSWANPTHALALRAWLEQHVARTPHNALSAEDTVCTDLAILSPWVAQVACIRDCLAESSSTMLHGVAVDTIHRFQGEEMPLILVDATISLPPGRSLPTFLRAQVLGDIASRLILVAMTRAKTNVVLIANMEYLSAHYHEAPILAAWLATFVARATRVDVGFLLPDHARVRDRRAGT